MTQRDLFPTTISSVPDIHVSRSQLQDGKKEKKMTVTSGRTSLELLHAKDPLGAFSKTFMVTLPWVSTKCSLTWKVKATPQGRLLFQLVPKTHPIAETDSGLLHTPTAKANQMSPSMKERDKGSWGKEPPLWATPNTMDHLPPRSEEATRKMQEGQRKGRKLPSNLREQVDQDTMKLYQDPTMWPTPLSSDYKNMDTANQQSLSKAVKMWPTPRVSDTEGAVVKNVEMNNGSFSRVNKKGVRWGVKLKDAVHHMEKMWPTPTATTNGAGKNPDNPRGIHQGNALATAVSMWPTPTTRDHKGEYIGGRIRNGKVSMDTLDVAVQHTDNQSKSSGQLNPTWVEWLMGYPEGWTDLKD